MSQNQSKYYDQIELKETDAIEILKTEYFYLQNAIDKYDEKAISIKSWSITFSLTLFGSALISHDKNLFLLSSISSLLFWIIETYWKVFQKAYYQRTWDIERFLQNKYVEKFRVPNVTGSYTNEVKKILKNDFFKLMLLPQVYLPHFIILVIGFISWISKIQ